MNQLYVSHNNFVNILIVDLIKNETIFIFVVVFHLHDLPTFYKIGTIELHYVVNRTRLKYMGYRNSQF